MMADPRCPEEIYENCGWKNEALLIMEAIHRLNIDWDEVARTCGDPKCEGDCRWVRVLRDAGVIT
jgi:hypothetical protein